jgi:N-carbamoylputrescine amidase
MVMNDGKARVIRVAAIQAVSKLGKVEENMRHAMPLIKQAADKGAQLIVLPEMYVTGYAMTRQVWDLAEPEGGPIEQWLASTAKKLGVYLGAGLVEAAGDDFYNTFVIAGPDGKVAGRVRKTQAEFMLFKAGEHGSHVVDTAIGRIGVGICADTHMTFLPRLMQEQEVDILLMPHAWPIPYKLSKLISEKDIRDADKNARNYAALFVKMLGVPVIFVNHTGPIEGGRWAGILGRLMDAEHMRYAGYSAIVDSDMSVKSQVGREEGVLVADVTLDPSRKVKGTIPDYGGWVHPGEALLRKVILPVEIGRGKLGYRLSGERKRKALAASSGKKQAITAQ